MADRWRVLGLLALAACTAPTDSDLQNPTLAMGSPEARAYIVTLARGVDALTIAHAHGLTPRFVYRSALTGFAAEIPDQAIEGLRRNPLVHSIIADGIVRASATASWGIDRVDQRSLPLSGTFTPPNTGAGVRIYILDTGVRYTHPELSGRVAQGTDIIGGDDNADDCQGHGTHVAGTTAGTTVGIARQATIVSVRMLGCDGSATTSQAIAGVDWVAANHIKPAVANMSWGGDHEDILDAAVAGLVTAGVTSVLAAGNGNTDACGFSPASTPSGLTAGATTQNDSRAFFSNFGSCVDLFAPGDGIYSSLINGGYGLKSGTSMAAPHVAGVAALYLAANPLATPVTVSTALLAGATVNAVSDVMGSPNRLLYSQIAGAGVLPPLPPPPLPEPAGKVWIGDLDDVSTGSARRGQWWALVRIQLVAESGDPVEAQIEGMFFDLAGRELETGLCLIGITGECIARGTMPNRLKTVVFRLKKVSPLDGAEYHPERNTDPDSDSDGSVITVRKP